MSTKRNSREMNRHNTEGVASMIMSYLIDRPLAEDTLDGIVQWWLFKEEIRFETDRVCVALQKLVKSKKLLTRQRADGRLFYRLNPELRPRNESASG